MLNMSESLGGSGRRCSARSRSRKRRRATNGLAAVDRGPRELAEITTPEIPERFVMATVRYWRLGSGQAGSTSPGSTSAVLATLAAERRQVVRHQREPVFAGRGRRADPSGTPGLEIAHTPAFLHDPYLDHHPELASATGQRREPNPSEGGAAARAFTVELFIAYAGAAPPPGHWLTRRARGRAGVELARTEHTRGRLVPAGGLAHRAACRASGHVLDAARTFDTLENCKIVHGKVRWAGASISEAKRVADRALQVLGGPRYMIESPRRGSFRELRLGHLREGSEIQRLVIARGRVGRRPTSAGSTSFLPGFRAPSGRRPAAAAPAQGPHQRELAAFHRRPSAVLAGDRPAQPTANTSSAARSARYSSSALRARRGRAGSRRRRVPSCTPNRGGGRSQASPRLPRSRSSGTAMSSLTLPPTLRGTAIDTPSRQRRARPGGRWVTRQALTRAPRCRPLVRSGSASAAIRRPRP